MAYVLGQIEQNVGVIRCVDDCKFEDLPVVIFPGNVGDKTNLYNVVKKLKLEVVYGKKGVWISKI